MMYEVEFIKVETGELHKQDIQAIDWRNAVSECFSDRKSTRLNSSHT